MDKFVNEIICSDVSDVLRQLPSDFVDCVVTSPPYWALRDYGIKSQIWDGDGNCKHEWERERKTLKHKSGETNPGKEGWYKDKGVSDDKGHSFCLKCGAWQGSLGLEPTFDLFIKHLCDIFDEVKRVLKKEGTCWVNLGDTYSGSYQGAGKNTKERVEGKRIENLGSSKNYLMKYGHTLTTKPPSSKTSVSDKCLCLIPFRFAIEMVNRGWILRNVIVWHKPNCMPSSVQDRFTVDFEYIFFFTKDKKYWFEMQHEPQSENTHARYSKEVEAGLLPPPKAKQNSKELNRPGYKNWRKGTPKSFLSQGRNKRCVWTITTKPFKEAHFAVFPPQLVENPIMAGCPEFVCKKCGKARKKIFNTTTTYLPYKHPAGKQPGKIFSVNAPRWESKTNFIGYTDCGCDAGFNPGIVLDPFSGSGTTLAVAKSLGRNYLGIDLNPEYIKMAQRRIAKLDEDRKSETKR